MAGKMKESFRKQQWPVGWVKWLTENEAKQFHEGVRCVNGAIWVKVGMWLDIGHYLNQLANVLRQRGVLIYTHCNYSISQHDSHWNVTYSNGIIKADSLIIAAGANSNNFEPWQDIPLHPLKGQIAEFEVSTPLTFKHAISSLGYFIPSNSRTLSVGSTYEHSFENEQVTDEGANRLLEKAQRTFPYLAEKLSLKNQWAGIRATTPNKLPVTGRHPQISNLYILSGLGSKGLLIFRLIFTN